MQCSSPITEAAFAIYAFLHLFTGSRVWGIPHYETLLDTEQWNCVCIVGPAENTMTLQASVFQKLQKLTKLVEGGNDAQPSKQPLSAALTPGPPLKRLDNTIQNARRRKSLTVQAMRSQIEALKH